MFHLVEFVVAFWTFVVALALVVQHVPLKRKAMSPRRHVTERNALPLIWKNFYNCTGRDYIGIYLFDSNDCKYDFENPSTSRKRLEGPRQC